MATMEKVASFGAIAQFGLYNITFTPEEYEAMGVDPDILVIAGRGNETELAQVYLTSILDLVVSAGNDSYSGVNWLYPVAVSITICPFIHPPGRG